MRAMVVRSCAVDRRALAMEENGGPRRVGERPLAAPVGIAPVRLRDSGKLWVRLLRAAQPVDCGSILVLSELYVAVALHGNSQVSIADVEIGERYPIVDELVRVIEMDLDLPGPIRRLSLCGLIWVARRVAAGKDQARARRVVHNPVA